MSDKYYAFMKDFDDRGWLVVIVVKRTDEDCGEIVDRSPLLPTKADADAWRIARIGDGKTVYIAPEALP